MNFYKTLFLLITILLPVMTTSATTLNFDKQVVIDLRLPYQAEWMNTDVFSISANGAQAIKRGKQYFASKPEGDEYILGMDFMSSDVETSLVGLIVGSDESGIIIAHLKSGTWGRVSLTHVPYDYSARTDLATSAYVFNYNQLYNLQVHVNGNHIELIIDDQNILSHDFIGTFNNENIGLYAARANSIITLFNFSLSENSNAYSEVTTEIEDSYSLENSNAYSVVTTETEDLYSLENSNAYSEVTTEAEDSYSLENSIISLERHVSLTNYSCIHEGSGNEYNVGPEQEFTSISSVPWNSLNAGDTVRIFRKETPYQERIVINGQGTLDQPIRVCGVLDEDNNLPELSAKDATTGDNLNYGSWDDFQDFALVLVYNPGYTARPEHIIIEGLELSGANLNNSYFRQTNENVHNYHKGASAIRIQEGLNITIRNNVIYNNGSGIFAMSKPSNRESLTEKLLIENNHVFNNGVIDSYLEHNLYIQAFDVTYQYNYFGRTLSDSKGGNLKDRSAGTVIRYNYFEGGERYIDLVEAQEHKNWVIESEYLDSLGSMQADPERLAFITNAEENYRKSHVYGNIFKVVGSKDGRKLIHWGNDGLPELTRKGTMQFFNNTVVFHSNKSKDWKTYLFDVSTIDETIHAFNNIIYIKPETEGELASNLWLTTTDSKGTVKFDKNWISDGYFNGGENAVVEDAFTSIISGENNVAPIDLSTYSLTSESLAKDEAVVNPLLDEHPVAFQYNVDSGIQLRNTTLNIGAIEY